MFGAYPQIASYMQTGNDASVQNDNNSRITHQESLPAYLRPSFQPPQFWSQGRGKHGPTEDFIMVAEFSELEGPKPLMTIPKNVGANFDQNAFAVRILAVDCQNSADFSISEDSQIVMTDTQTGVFAFVHHLVLYDNTARGFVRPYCIAYITADQRKIMHCYKELSHQFRKVARYLKYGNKMLFVGDLERHLRDLEYTKNFLLNQVSKIRLRNVEESNPQVKDVRRNAENELYKALYMIQESSIEIKKIIAIFKPLLLNRRLEDRFKMLEEKAFQRAAPPEQDRPSLQEGWFNDLSGLDELNMKCNSVNGPRISPLAMFKPREYKPVLVKTKKAKRFNAPLRGLHELCSWGAKEGLRKLRHIHVYFKRDMTVHELEKNESRFFYPNNASISHGQCITGNFLSDVHMNRFDTAREIEQSWSTLYSYNWGFAGSAESLVSLKSAVSHPSSLNGIDEASPLSENAFESQSALVLYSASSSPVKEFSLLTNHEYYPGLDEENTSPQMSFKNDDDGISKTLIPESGNYFQEHQSIFSGNSTEEKAEEIDQITRILSQPDSQILENDPNVDINRAFNICCQICPSDLSFSKDCKEINTISERKKTIQEITHSVKDTFMEYEFEADISELSKTPFAKTNNLNIVLDSSNFKVENKCTTRPLARKHSNNRPNVLACEGSAIQSYVCNENCCLESSLACGDKTNDHSNASLDENAAFDHASIDTQSHSAHTEQISEHAALTDSSIKSGIIDDGLSTVLVRKIKSKSYRDLKTVSSTSEDDQESLLKHTGIRQSQIKNQIKKEYASNLLKPDENICFGLPTSLSAPEDLLTDSEMAQSVLTSSWILKNGSVFAKDIASESIAEYNIKLAVKGNSKNGSASKLSNLISQNQRHYAHQITEQTRSQNGKICPPGTNHELKICPTGTNHELKICPTGTNHELKISPTGSKPELKISPTGSKPELKISPTGSKPELKISPTGSKPELKISPTGSKPKLKISPTGSKHELKISPTGSKPELKISPTGSKPELKISPTGSKPKLKISPTGSKPELKISPTGSKPELKISPTGSKPELKISPTGSKPELKISPAGSKPQLSYRRVRSESDVASILSTSSANELHPHLLDEKDEPPSTKDNYQMHGLSERFEATDAEEDYVGIQFSHHSGVWKPRCGVYTVGDWINNLAFGRPGHCLSEVLATYQKLEHVIFSLLCGRPVLVVGPAKLEQDVVKLVNALAVFVPGAGRKCPAIIEWTSQCLRITDLAKLKLVGVCRPERRSADSFIPSAIKRACSVVDVEKRTISAPPYQGQFIATLLTKKKVLKSDVQLLSYIEWWLMDILAKAFLFFHIFCLGSAGSILYSHSPKDQRDAYCDIVTNILSRLGVRDHDCEIIEHLTELVKMAELEPHIWLDADLGNVIQPLALQHKICEKFRC